MKPSCSSRHGIALVIVLGLMAMLAILGISFATTMRTEHRAARMSGDNLGAIEMTYYGLAEALYHLERDADNTAWVAPNWTRYTIHSGDNGYHPDRSASSGLNDMLTWYGTWFVPSAIIGGTNLPSIYARAETNNVRWIMVKTPAPESRVVGQFCYMLIDVSGFLDPNGNYSMAPGLATNQLRSLGTNVTELALTNVLLGELRGGRERFCFDGRIGSPRSKPYGRIETLADMRPALAWADFWPGSQQPMFNLIATNFFPFSYYPPGYADPNTREARRQVDLRGTGTEIAARAAEIRAALTGLIPAGDLDMFMNNLIDYVDSDYVPGGLASTIGSGANNADSFCTEPVPMLNELQIGCIYQSSGANIALRFRVNTELFFPFLFTSNAINGSAPPPPQVQLRFRGRLEGGTFEPRTFNQTLTIPWNSAWWVNSFSTAMADPTSPQLTVHAINLTMSAPATNAIAPERFVIEEWSVTLPNGVVLDRLAPVNNGVVASLNMGEYLSQNVNSPQAYYCGWECDDPRINWLLLDRGVHWPGEYKQRALSNPLDPDTTTLGRMNRAAKKEQNEWVMFVSNEPLYSIGELGYLLLRRDRPWMTISFFPSPSGRTEILPVLDRFTLYPYPRHGLVNINSRITNVLATAFNACPVELAPGIRASPERITPAEAREIAAAIIGSRPPPGFINMSDIRNVPQLSTVVPRITSWIAREGLIRNTHGLLGIRQNLILALIAGQSLQQFRNPETGNNETRRMAGHRAFATIWRDPYKENIGGQLMHRTFVRNFRWYDEWVGTGLDESVTGP